jgi:hypothetical protein
MQRWEYITVIAKDGSIISINGDSEKAITKKAEGFFGSDKHFSLEAYLKMAGNDGWEVTGVSPIEGTGEIRGSISFILIMKKPLQVS